jgi:two-component system, chemotaxis family, chemotaxis protein CheY
MKTLIVEDDSTSRMILQQALKTYGPVHIAADGEKAVEAVRAALAAREPYTLICLDIVMPGMDGQAALKEIRALEGANGLRKAQGAKIVMTTAQADANNFSAAFEGQCDEYLVKPIYRLNLLETLRQLGLV